MQVEVVQIRLPVAGVRLGQVDRQVAVDLVGTLFPLAAGVVLS